MFSRLPVLIDHPRESAAIARLLDLPDQCALGTSQDHALRLLRKHVERAAKQERLHASTPWEEAKLLQKQFELQPAVFRDGKRYPTGPKVSLPVRYIELKDHRQQLFLHLPDFGEIVFVADSKLLPTILADSVRSLTANLTPEQVHSLWPPSHSDLQWVRVSLEKPRTYQRRYDDRLLRAVAEPVADRRNQVMPGSRTLELELLRRTVSQQSCLVVGESGVGKSTLIATLAREIQLQRREEKKQARDSFEQHLLAPAFWQTSGGRLIAGMRYLGQWQQRLEAIVAELSDIQGVLVVENLLDLMTVGGTSPRDSLAAFLIPYLRSENLRLVAEASPTELDACARLLPTLVDVLPIVRLDPMSEEEEANLLQWRFSTQLQAAQIEVDEHLPVYISRLCRQFQRHGFAPGPAMRFADDLIGKRMQVDTPEHWTVPWMLESFAKRTGLPLELIDDDFTLSKDEVFAELRKEVVGQDAACKEVASIVTRIKSSVNDPRRPFGCLMFCGPTGVGKTQLAKSLAKYLFGSSERNTPLIRLDMSEYSGVSAGHRFLSNSDGHSARWIQQIRARPLSVLLLDEIEKASSEVFEILLSILDEGRLTDRLGRVTSFRNTVILMTSNVGARRGGSLGFGDDPSQDYVSEVKKAFKPEFFNRLDSVVSFQSLNAETVRLITTKELEDLQRREGIERFGRKIRWTPQLVDFLSKVGVEAGLGARPLQRAVETHVVAPLSTWLVNNPHESTSQLRLDWDEKHAKLSIAIADDELGRV